MSLVKTSHMAAPNFQQAHAVLPSAWKRPPKYFKTALVTPEKMLPATTLGTNLYIHQGSWLQGTYVASVDLGRKGIY